MRRLLAVLIPLGVTLLAAPVTHAQQAVAAGAYLPTPVALGLSVHWQSAAPAPVVLARAHAPAVVIAVPPAWAVHGRPVQPHGHRRAFVPYPAHVHGPAYGYGRAYGYGYGYGPAHGYGYGPAHGYGPAYGHGPAYGYGPRRSHPPAHGHDHGRAHDHGRHDPDWNGPYRPWRH